MADVTGLVIGAVALASLFSTCIDLFDRFELGRNYVYDYELACTKLALLRARLTAWGVTLNVDSPGNEHASLRQHWTDEKDVIARSLLGIHGIFENASLLAERYRLSPKRLRSFRSISLHRSQAATQLSLETNADQPRGWSFLKKRTSWAIHDKEKFDALIQDLSFLITNLEKVLKRLDMPSTEEQLAHARAMRHADWQKRSSQSSSVESGTAVTITSKHAHEPGTKLNVYDVARGFNGHLITGKQTVDNVGVMGTVGAGTQRHVFTGDQDIKRGAFGVMGDMSEDVALRMKQQDNDRLQELRK